MKTSYEERIRDFLTDSFDAGAPKTKQAYDMRDELISSVTDRYHGLVDAGREPENAFNEAINSIGDLNELFVELQPRTKEEDLAERRRSAGLISTAVVSFILSVIWPIIFSRSSNDIIGIVLFFAFIAFGVGLLVYNGVMSEKKEDEENVVTDFRNWKANESNDASVFKALNSALWSVILVLYFVISFTTGQWHITWVIFILGGAAQAILNAVFASRRH